MPHAVLDMMDGRPIWAMPDWVPDEPTVRALVEGLVVRMGREPEGDER